MKSWLKRNMINICAGITLFFDVYYISSHSFCLFGEPEFPVEN